MSCDQKHQNSTSWAHLPEDVWVEILNNLRLTDLVFVSLTCRHFNCISRTCIERQHRRTSFFAASHEFIHYGVSIAPDVNPESGQAVCFDETNCVLKLLHLPTGLLIASSPETSCFPVSLKFSATGNFVVACFDSKVCFYRIDTSCEKLAPCLRISFDVPITDFVPPGHGRCRYGMGRIIVSFSRNDSKIAVAHVSESSGSARFLTFKCITASIFPHGRNERETIDLQRLQLLDDQNATTVRLDVCKEFVNDSGILMNADPLRFLIPPGCIDESGILFDPLEPLSMLRRRIEHFDPKFGKLIAYCFSSCGNYYIETRQIGGQTGTITITKHDLASGLLSSINEVRVGNLDTILCVLISEDSHLAIILLGTITGSNSILSAWYVANLCGDGYLYVHCQTPVCTSEGGDFSYDRTFGLSYDGQLLSVSCYGEKENRYFTVKIFETATGKDVDALKCAIPSDDGILRADWHNGGRSVCYHVSGGHRTTSLTAMTLGDHGVSFSHANGR